MSRSAVVQAIVWVLFFATSVYGHVAIKLATGGEGGGGAWSRAWSLGTDPWTISGVASWCLSGVLWVAILDGSPLSEATSIASARYALVILAAFLVLGEGVGWRQALGMGFIAVGIALVKWKVA